jgi:hypothetical protein
MCRNSLNVDLRTRWLPRIGFLAVFGAGLATRLIFAGTAKHPGHGDLAFYFTLAENIVDGRGFLIDYIWNYMNNPETITQSSHGFWMPLTSIIISLSMFVFGKSLFVALLPSIMFGLALAVPVYFFARTYSGSKSVAIYSSGLVLFVPYLFVYSLLTDSPIYYAMFVSLGLLFMLKSESDPKFFLLAAVCASLAHLTRQDGVLFLLTLEGVILLSRWPNKTKCTYIVLTLGLYAVILLPLIIDNYRVFGSPFPPGPFKMMFLTHYEDHYSYSKELDLQAYLRWGMPNILQSKVSGAVVNARILYQRFLGNLLRVFVLVGLLDLFATPDGRQKWRKYFPPLFFLTLLFSFYAIVVPVGSGATGFTRSSISIIPFLVVLVIDTVHRNIRSKAVVFLIVLLIGASSSYESIQFAQETINTNTEIGQRLEALGEILANDAYERSQRDIIIMTRNPWEVYHATRQRAIQIPNEDLDTIYAVAEKFKANYLLLPAPRRALEGIYQGSEIDPSSLSERADFSAGRIDGKLIPCLSHSSEPTAGSVTNDSQVQQD